MKVLILGATGQTGALTVAAARRAGHRVSVLVRDASKLPTVDGLTVHTGDATSVEDLSAALHGQDAVISALGAGNATKSTIASTSALALTEAAEREGVSRVIVLSAFGVGDSLASASLSQRLIFGTAMKGIFSDKAIGDATVASSSLDATIVRPVTLNNNPASGTYQVAESLRMKGMPRISRADVADFLVASLDDREWSKRTAVLSA